MPRGGPLLENGGDVWFGLWISGALSLTLESSMLGDGVSLGVLGATDPL